MRSGASCAQAIPLFEQCGDHRWLALAWHVLAQAEMQELQVQAAAQAWENAAAQAQLAGDRAFELFIRGESVYRIGMERSSYATAVHELERLVEEFPGEPAVEGVHKATRSYYAFHAGRREQARLLVRDAIDVARRIGMPWWAAMLRASSGSFAMMSGDLDEAERLALAGIGELRELGERSWLGLALALLARIRIAQSRYTDALELADEADEYGGDHWLARIEANAVRARAHGHLGELEKARAAAAKAAALAERADSLRAQADAQYALAETLAAADELPAALAAAEEAARLYATLEYTILAQRTTTLAGQIERRLAPTPVA